MNVVIILPTYNEKNNVGNVLQRILDISPKRKQNILVLVVDDNSPDKTAEIVQKFAKRNKKVQLLLRKEKNGLGAAYAAGMDYAFNKMDADLVITMDADLSHDPSYIPSFLKKVQDGADFVVGSRYQQGGSIAEGWALHRKLLSFIANKLAPLILGIDSLSDWTSGFRAIRKKVYNDVLPNIRDFRGYTFNISFAYYAATVGKAKITEVPIKFVDRREGKSKLGFEYLFYAPLFLIKTRLKKIFRV